MKAAAKGTVLYDFEVTHPVYGVLHVSSIERGSASIEAARRWGADWAREVAYMDVKKGGKAQRPRCRRCTKEFATAGAVGLYCPDCARDVERDRREMANIRRPDRRAGYR